MALSVRNWVMGLRWELTSSAQSVAGSNNSIYYLGKTNTVLASGSNRNYPQGDNSDNAIYSHPRLYFITSSGFQSAYDSISSSIGTEIVNQQYDAPANEPYGGLTMAHPLWYDSGVEQGYKIITPSLFSEDNVYGQGGFEMNFHHAEYSFTDAEDLFVNGWKIQTPLSGASALATYSAGPPFIEEDNWNSFISSSNWDTTWSLDAFSGTALIARNAKERIVANLVAETFGTRNLVSYGGNYTASLLPFPSAGQSSSLTWDVRNNNYAPYGYVPSDGLWTWNLTPGLYKTGVVSNIQWTMSADYNSPTQGAIGKLYIKEVATGDTIQTASVLLDPLDPAGTLTMMGNFGTYNTYPPIAGRKYQFFIGDGGGTEVINYSEVRLKLSNSVLDGTSNDIRGGAVVLSLTTGSGTPQGQLVTLDLAVLGP
jgi:hypothetical protein